MTSRLACACALAIGIGLFSSDVARGQGPVRYIYDDLGRLIGVVDGNGDSAVYVYDAVGNLLSIERHTSGAVAILQFSPHSGPIGSIVTIHGIGFSATPGQNTFTFNGVAATVQSATPTELVVAVPAGATSGTIAVTTPSGSASGGSFTVTSSNNAPTITSFTPTIGVAGTAVTITGTNFQTVATNDRTMFNVRHAAVTSSTATMISTAVPSLAGSGRISVYTPFGGAIGDDFFIAPSPYTASQVAVTGRWNVNQSTSMSIGTTNKIGLSVFEGSAGHRLSLRGTNATFTGTTGCDVEASILNPDGTVLSPAGCMEGSGFLDAVTTPITGTYTILVHPSSSATGSLTLTPYDFLDVTGTISPNGSAVTATTTIAGQNGRYTFSGTVNQRVSLRGTSGVTGQLLGCDVFTSIVKPDGVNAAAPTCMEGSGFIDATTLPSTGTYTVLMDPATTVTGSLTLNLYDVPADVTGSITPGGPAVTVTTTAPGQNGTLTFSGTANQRVILVGTNGMSGQVGLACDVNVTIRKPDGTQLATTCMEGSGVIDTQTLPTTGTYSIFVDPTTYAVGSVTLTLGNVPADVTGSATADGSLVSATNTAAGQNAVYQFSGTMGQRVSLYVGAAPNTTVFILRPNGASLGSVIVTPSASNFLEPVTLLETGTHTVFVDFWSTGVGTAPFRLYTVPADTTTSVTINGSAATVALGTPGQNGFVTFSGTANQLATVHVTSNSYTWVNVALWKPDGSLVTHVWSGSASFNLSQVTLPVTGTYSISINPADVRTGSMNIAVTSP